MLELLIILILIVFNGVLAMSEIAFVSAKRFRLKKEARQGSEAARKALALLQEPEEFLSAIQIGITLVGVLAGALGGYALAEDIAPYIRRIEFLSGYATQISFILIVTAITYLSLVIGELVPKSIALSSPHRITLAMAGFMHFLSKAFAPLVWFLSASTRMIVFLFPIKENEEPPVSEDEVKSMLEVGTRHGTFEEEESEMINKIFNFNDKRVSEVMIPRTDIEWIDASMSHEEVFGFIDSHHYSRYVVSRNTVDDFIGILDSREFLLKYHNEPGFDLKSLVYDPLVVPDSIYTMDLLDKFQTHKRKIALIVDEYGGIRGFITLHDLIEDIVGDIPEEFEQQEQEIVKRGDDSYLVDGSVEVRRLAEFLPVKFNHKEYQTAGGFMMNRLGKIPAEGDLVHQDPFTFEVLDMDGKKVDKILIKKK